MKKELRARKLVSAAPPAMQQGLQMVMDVRAYREKPARRGKKAGKRLAQALWDYLVAHPAQALP